MNRKEFCKGLAARNQVSVASCLKACDIIFTYLAECLKSENRVYISGLGTFKRTETREGRVDNLIGDIPVAIPSSAKLVFSPSRTTKRKDKAPAELLQNIINMCSTSKYALVASKILSAKRLGDVRTCQCCGRMFVINSNVQKYCSIECRDNYNKTHGLLGTNAVPVVGATADPGVTIVGK